MKVKCDRNKLSTHATHQVDNPEYIVYTLFLKGNENTIMENTTTTKINTYAYVLCALFAALTAVCTFINIPLPFTPIPINLATLSVFLAGGVLGPKYGTLSQFVYILLGAIGLPIFSNFQGGLGVLIGPTGGYLLGYVLAAFAIGLILKNTTQNTTENEGKFIYLKTVFACVVGMVVYFTLGTAWFMFLTNTKLWAALISCVFPFLLGDALKILAATLLMTKLRKAVNF